MKQIRFLKDVYLRVPLQGKIFYLLATVGVVFSAFNGFFNLFIGLPIITVIISFITGGGCLAALIYSYKQKKYKGPAYAAFHVLILFILPFLWITNSGSKGPTGFFYIFILILIGIIVDRPKIPFLLALMLVTLTSLVYIEIKYPEWIVSYNSRMAQILDMAVSAFMVGIITLGILLRLMKEYNLRITELNDMHSKLYELSITDELTGVFNRRFIMKELETHLDMQKIHHVFNHAGY